MNVRKRIIALVFIPVLSLFATVALADVSGEPDLSDNASLLNYDNKYDEIKNASQCGGATFFKNAFPSLTNGTPGGETTIDFPVDGKVVSMTVTWFGDDSLVVEDNSFGFEIFGGWASRVGVTVDQNNFVYEYSGPEVGIDDPADGFVDNQLNYYAGLSADDVNHLDLCLLTLDNTGPSVNLRVEPSTDGKTVFGTISVIAEITDESQPDPADLDITITSEPDGTVITLDSSALSGPTGPTPCLSGEPDCEAYTWTWDTQSVPSGEYKITVDATDTSVLANPGSGSILVTVFNVESCLEGFDGPGGTVLGCNPTGFMWNELPDELGETDLLDGQTLAQVAVPAFASAQDDLCGGPIDQTTGERPFPFAARDPRWSVVNGVDVYDPRPLDLAGVFDLSVFIPGPVTGKAEMRADTRGEPCIALLYDEASFNFAYFYDPANFPNLQGSQRYTYTLTQLPETQELGLNIPADIGLLGPNQIDLQRVPEATYQPTDRFIEPFIGNQLGPFTFKVFNPIRIKTPDFSFYVLGTVQICEELLGSGLVGRPYYEAVLQCKTDLAVEYFDDLDTLLAYVGEPSLPIYPEACLISPSAENLRVDLNRARSMIKVGDWTKARTRLDDLLLQALQADWLVDDRNCPGHVEMRIRNLLWRNDQLEIAEDNLPLQ